MRKREGITLDVGIGTAYTTLEVFGEQPVIEVDCHFPNLSRLKHLAGQLSDLCSEAFEHLKADGQAVAKIGRVHTAKGIGIVRCPTRGWPLQNFLSFYRSRLCITIPVMSSMSGLATMSERFPR